jgi:peptide chain release factor 1
VAIAAAQNHRVRASARPLRAFVQAAKPPDSRAGALVAVVMQAKLRAKIENIAERQEELGEMICDSEVMADKQRYLALSREHAELSPVALTFGRLRELERQLDEARELLEDPDMRELAQADVRALEDAVEQTTGELTRLLTPKDPNDGKNVILEIRAGTGGDEAGLFVADLWRMYSRYAERHKLTIDQVQFSENSAGGFKEISGRVIGRDVYAKLKFERGVHRVQRVPATESQGRIHTSTATVAVMPEAEEIDVEIDPSDIEFETMRSSGSGGQHVNTTDSAVRITHKPTGIAIRVDQEKSQIKNRDLALRRLRSKLLELEIEKAEAERAADRREQIGTGERSEKIRTYNYPQDRITDHRVGLTRHNLNGFMDGDIDDVLAALRQDEEAARMSELA